MRREGAGFKLLLPGVVVVFSQQGLVAHKQQRACRRSGAKRLTAALHYRTKVFKVGAGQTPFRTDWVTQPVQGGERERKERENQTSFCSFQLVDRLQSEGKSSGGHNHGECPTSAPRGGRSELDGP